MPTTDELEAEFNEKVSRWMSGNLYQSEVQRLTELWFELDKRGIRKRTAPEYGRQYVAKYGDW